MIPFLCMLLITGIPLVFMEMAFGQFASCGVVSVWSVCPLFEGETLTSREQLVQNPQNKPQTFWCKTLVQPL